MPAMLNFYGTDGFRISHQGAAEYPPGATQGSPIPYVAFMFHWPIRGSLEWHDGRGGVHEMFPGTLGLSVPGDHRVLRFGAAGLCRHAWFDFLPDRRWLATLPDPATWTRVRTLPANDIALPLIEHLAWLLESDTPERRANAQQLTGYLLRAYVTGCLGRSGHQDHQPHPLVEKVLGHVLKRWTDGRMHPISMTDLCRVCGVSKTHLTRLFTVEYGLPPLRALRRIRLDRAGRMLVETSLPITDIAWQCGFDDPLSFSTAFRRELGVSPRDYRRKPGQFGSSPTSHLIRVRRLGEQLMRPFYAGSPSA
jgi:AraC-like DNA-binding protein